MNVAATETILATFSPRRLLYLPHYKQQCRDAGW